MSDDRRALVTSTAGGDLSEILVTDACDPCEGTGLLDDQSTPCPACKGTGKKRTDDRSLCANCLGYGEIPERAFLKPEAPAELTGRMIRCPACKGSGLHRPGNRRRVGTAMMVGSPMVGLYGGFLAGVIVGAPGFAAFAGAAAVLFIAGAVIRATAPAETPQRSAPRDPG